MDNVDYFDTFIAVSPDSRAATATAPPPRGDSLTVAGRTFSMLDGHPYEHTSGDVIFTVMADRAGIPQADRPAARAEFFSRGRACLRSSDLGKRYGWGLHHDAEGRVALVAVDSPEYAEFAAGRAPGGGSVAVTAAMRSSRTP